MNRILLRVLAIVVLVGGVTARAADLPGSGDDTGKTVVYRDTFGVPHIFAPTPEAGQYAIGYATAEDRPEQLLMNLLTGIGELASVAGKAAVESDLRARMWDHYGVGQRKLADLGPEVLGHLKAYVKGINDFFESHPQDRPAWWGDRKVDEAMVLAWGRLFLYNWSIDEVFEDLERGGVKSNYQKALRGSNQFTIAPSRSAEGAAILAVDPHLSWWGPSRFWQVRIHAGDFEGSGVTLAGSPYIGLGHNANVAWAMTTGGPDTADVFELTLNEDGTKYLYDGNWRDLISREVTLNVRGEDPQVHTLWFSHHGPIISRQGGKAYAGAVSYGEEVTLEAWHLLNMAKDYTGAVAAMDTLTLFPQNVMVADTSGNIYYQRTGRVPRRAEGFDWSRPVDGSTPATEWQGMHPASDHLQVLNPPQGYMQNCNIPPDAMMVGSPFSLDKTKDYLYASLGYGEQRGGWTQHRGARAVQLLHNDNSVTAAEAQAYINDIHPYGTDRWIEALKQADAKHGAAHAADPNYAAALAEVLAWDGDVRADSTAALKFYYWKRQLKDDPGGETLAGIAKGIDAFYSVVEDKPAPPVSVTDENLALLAQAFAKGIARLAADFGSLKAVWGDKFRVGRDDLSWPVEGSDSVIGRTLRSMEYSDERADHTQWGDGGQTSTQIIVLTKPIQSWGYIPVGESDRKDSPHYRDQAEKLFSKRTLEPTRWMAKDLEGHIESRTVLDNAPQ